MAEKTKPAFLCSPGVSVPPGFWEGRQEGWSPKSLRITGFHETQRRRSAWSISPSAKELLRAGSWDPLPACTPQGYFIMPASSVTARQSHTTAKKFLHRPPRACLTSVIRCPQRTLKTPGAESPEALQTPFIFAIRSFQRSTSREGRTRQGTACSGQGLLSKLLSLP